MSRLQYNNRRWIRERKLFLQDHPLCRMCMDHGKVTPATVVDHVIPHRGDDDRFWEKSNWQALCKHCHDSHKQRLETSGRSVGARLDGSPTDPRHHWNR